MDFPEWVLKQKQKGTELRKIGNNYYLYKIKSVWNKSKSRSKKVTEKYLGKITEEGLIKPKHEMVTESLKNISVKEFGAADYVIRESEDIIQNLKETFPNDWKEIFVFAFCRFFHSSPLKNVHDYYYHSQISDEIRDAHVSPKCLGKLLHVVGQQRERIKHFFSKYIDCGENIVVDITHMFSRSENIISATLGNNPDNEYTPQINLFLLYSLDKMQPMYYRMFVGSIADVSSLALSMKESGVKNAITVGDKGFYSVRNAKELDNIEGMNYILPVKRNSKMIDYDPIKQAGKLKFDGHFLYENRVIWYYERKVEKGRIVTFLDGKLKTEEERDCLIRAKNDKTKLENYHKTEHRFGTISIVTKTELKPQKIFEVLKSRVDIEGVFDILKNVLNADKNYMRDDHALEGWMFVNFIALLLYYKMYGILVSKNMLNKYSPRDVLLHLSRVFKVKVGDEWLLSEIPKKSRTVAEKLDIKIHIT